MLIWSVFWAVFATAWHRLILLDERSSYPVHFKFGRRERNFFWRGLQFYFLIVGIAFAFFAAPLIFENPKGNDMLSPLLIISFFAGFVAVVIACKFGLILPAAAVGVESFGLGDSWRATDTRGFQFVIGSILCFLPFEIPAGILLGFVSSDANYTDAIFILLANI